VENYVRHGHHASCLAYECDVSVVIPLMICFDLNPNVQACVITNDGPTI